MKSRHSITALLLFLTFFSLYIYTMPPTVYWQDSGIYLSGLLVEGNVYPPGFPLYMMVGHLWAKIVPIGSFTQKVHALSALFAAVSTSIIYLAVLIAVENKSTLFKKKTSLEQEIVKDDSTKSSAFLSQITALLAALLLGLNFNVWSQAINAEVYTFHLFFIAFLLYLIFLIGEKGRIEKVISPKQRFLIILTGIAYGLSYGNHPMTVVLIPAFLFLIFNQRNILYHKKLIALVIVLFVLCALGSYIYLPVIANSHPTVNWGNPNTIDRFITHVTGKAYVSSSESFVFNDMTRYKAALNEFVWEFGYAGIVLALIGAFKLFKNSRTVACLTGIIAVFHILFAVFYKQTTEYNSWLIPTHWVVILWICYAINNGLQHISQNGHFVRKTVFVSVLALFCVFLIQHTYTTYMELNRQNYYYAQDFGENILRNLDKNSLVIMTGDQESSTVMYLQTVLKYRTDIMALKNIEAEELTYPEGRQEIKHRYPSLSLPEFSSDSPQTIDYYYNKIVDANSKDHSIYLMSKAIFNLDTTKYALLPVGAMYKIIPANCDDCQTNIDLKYWNFRYHDNFFYLKKERPLMSLKDSSKPGGINRVPFIQHMINFELQAWKNLGDLYLVRGECKKAEESYNNMKHLQNNIFETLPQLSQAIKSCKE